MGCAGHPPPNPLPQAGGGKRLQGQAIRTARPRCPCSPPDPPRPAVPSWWTSVVPAGVGPLALVVTPPAGTMPEPPPPAQPHAPAPPPPPPNQPPPPPPPPPSPSMFAPAPPDPSPAPPGA